MSITNFNLRKRLGMKLAQDDGAGNGGTGSETNSTDNSDGEGEGTKETNQKEEKTFTQADVDRLIKERLAREKKGQPSKEDLEAFNNWKESQKTAEQKQAEKEAEYQRTLNELNTLKQTNAVLSAGVNKDDADYVLFKVSKMEGEFEENLAKFLKDNPKYLKQELEKQEHKATGAPVKTISSKNDGVLGILANKHPEINFD